MSSITNEAGGNRDGWVERGCVNKYIDANQSGSGEVCDGRVEYGGDREH